jgi:hypothetical protein
VDDWAHFFARCYEMAGVTPLDRVQIAVGYGLWTAGVGFQAGCERVGAMAVPTDLGTWTSNASSWIFNHGLLLFLRWVCCWRGSTSAAREKINLKRSSAVGAVVQSMRKRISDSGEELFDIPGLPGCTAPGRDSATPRLHHYWGLLFSRSSTPTHCNRCRPASGARWWSPRWRKRGHRSSGTGPATSPGSFPGPAHAGRSCRAIRGSAGEPTTCSSSAA